MVPIRSGSALHVLRFEVKHQEREAHPNLSLATSMSGCRLMGWSIGFSKGGPSRSKAWQSILEWIVRKRVRLTNNFVYRISGAISAIRGCLLPIPQCRVNKVKCRWQGTSSSQEGGKESGRLPSLSHDSQTSKFQPLFVSCVSCAIHRPTRQFFFRTCPSEPVSITYFTFRVEFIVWRNSSQVNP